MARIVECQRRRRNVVAAAPDLHLRLAVLLDGLRLVESLQRAVVAFVEAPAALDRQPHEVHLVEHAPQRADRALEHRGEGDVGHQAGLLDLDARGARFDAALVGKIDVMPSGEEILDVPGALAVTNEDEFSGHADLRFRGRHVNRQIWVAPCYAQMRVESAFAADLPLAARGREHREIGRQCFARCRRMVQVARRCRRTAASAVARPAFSRRAHSSLSSGPPALDRPR